MPREKETLRLRTAELASIGVVIAFSLLLPLILSARAEQPLAEPSLVAVLNNLGYTNIALSSVQTFSAGSYEAKLLAEFAGYHATNEFSYYPVSTSNFILVFSGPEGNNGYVIPPVTKTFSSTTAFGCSLYVAAESHRYFTETSRNPDGLQHAKIYVNLDNPDMYFIGFENVYGTPADRDFQDMVVSLEPIKHYLNVETDPLGITTITGEGWYNNATDVELTSPSTVPVSTGVRYDFRYWDVDGASQGLGVNPITVNMNANHTATAHYTLQYYLTVTSPYGTTGGQGWYDNGANAYATLSTGTVDHGNGTRRVFTSWSSDASGTNYAQSNPIQMNGPKTAIANWKTRCLLTLATNPSGVTTPSGGGWYDAGAYASISTVIGVDIVPGSSRYKLNGWTTADMSEIADPSSPSTTVFMDKPKTVTANYKTEYYLTITHTSGGVTDPPSGGWYDAGTTASVIAIPDPDYVLNRWELDGSPVGSANPYTVLMNSAHTLHAVFEYSPPPPTTYYLTVKTDPLGITSIPGQGWYDEGEDVILTAPSYVDVSTGTRYKFAYWDVDGVSRGAGVNPITVNINANHTATSHYTLRYYLTVTSPYDTPTPTSGWFDAGTTITASVTSPWAGTAGTRYVCTGWTGAGSVPASGTAASVVFTINAPSSISWNWKTQYHLTVETVPSGIASIPGVGWYDMYTTVPLTAPNVTGYEFHYWDVNGIPQGNGITSISVIMNMPYTATAHYLPIVVGGSAATIELHLTHAWISINSILAAAFCIAAFYMKKRFKRV